MHVTSNLQSSILTLMVIVIVKLVYIVVAYMSGSLLLTADSLHQLSDSTQFILILTTFLIIYYYPSPSFNKDKLIALIGLVVLSYVVYLTLTSLLGLVTEWLAIVFPYEGLESLTHLFHDHGHEHNHDEHEISALSTNIPILILGFLHNLAVFYLLFTKRENPAIAAIYLHMMNDLLLSAFTLFSAIIAYELNSHWVVEVLSLVLFILILKKAITIIKTNVFILIDKQ